MNNKALKIAFRSASIACRALIATIIVADALARPLYRPLLNWVSQWKIMQAFEALVARLPRLAILVLFAVPFAVAEPLKIVGLLEIAEGHVAYGIGVLIFSYILTFFLVERIYHAGRTKLLSYGWFAWGMGYINAVRDVVVAYKTRTIRKANALFRVIRRGAAA